MSYSTHPHLLCRPHRLYCVFMLESNSLLLSFVFFTFLSCFFVPFDFVSVQCCLLQKWGLVNIAVSDVASCLAVFVSLSLSLHAFFCLLFLFPSAFGSFSPFVFDFCLFFGFVCLGFSFFVKFFLSFLGVTELRLSELSVCYWTVRVSVTL